MCGRFTLTTPADVVAAVFRLLHEPQWQPRYNIAPTQPVGVVRHQGGTATPTPAAASGAHPSGEEGRRFDLLRWGLVPRWAKEPDGGVLMINARAEGIASKPAFRAAVRFRRCLIPADGFFEWQKLQRRKQPFYIRRRDASVFAFAGLWEHWEGPDGAVIESCTIITTEANDVVRPLHDRMPVILAPAEYELWLDPQVQDAQRVLPLLRPCPSEALEAYPVSAQVNRPTTDRPECVAPLAAQLPPQEHGR
ncbi:MAG TPA: SOS response-associated peptidase [Phycisphaerae bacterium]|nr:SOS response-associated peptidase [Phycisphaerae bacterium]HNU46920.1 SOS response-associated peptidase [Phycisphaerae bacterium]